MSLLAVSIFAIFVGIIVICFLGDDSAITFWSVVLCIFGGVLLGLSIEKINQEKVPTALDVYNGKTTLEITYRDSVAIDSVVVFKNK